MKYKLRDLIRVTHGYAFKSENFSDFPTSNILLTPGNVKIGGGFNLNKKKYYAENVKIENDYIFSAGDMFITMTDLSKEGDTLGYPAIVPNTKDFIFLHNQRLGKVYIERKDVLDPMYLYYLLCSREYRGYILGTATGSTVKHTSPSKVLNFEVDLPPISIQKKIGHTLKLLDSKIEINNQIVSRLETISKTLFKNWFIDFEFPNEQGQPYKSSGGEMTESELGEIPEGWKIGSADELFEFSPTEKLSKGTMSTYVEMKNLQNSAMIYNQTKREFKSGSKFRNGDTLLARITPCLENGKIGFVDFLKGNEVGWGSTEFIVIRTKENIHNSFSYFFASEPTFKQYAIANMNGSSGRQRVKAETLAQYKLAIPPLKLIEKFTTISESNMKMMTNFKGQIVYLEELRDILLPKLLSGEIEISGEVVVG
ncbi:restriction endonuclease subunit S [Priestia megaterium]|uniref:restriction endonuclease subunit S n=1 Tax=Priestia megaterium TaxID=1404 RepID=UPI000BF99034|nr:restriction endonuclease subunit S [Priestia megaterium]PFI60707.1 restriction endonuclease subunit S [Priestia megaterium]